MSQVFIWNCYGDIRVYFASTPEQIKNLLDVIYETSLANIDPKQHGKVQQIYEKNKDAKPKALINWLIEETRGESESFEGGTGFYEVRDLCS